jgi:hypothetical protein
MPDFSADVSDDIGEMRGNPASMGASSIQDSPAKGIDVGEEGEDPEAAVRRIVVGI